MLRGNLSMQIVTSLLKRQGKLNIQRITTGLHGQIRLSSACFQVTQLWQKKKGKIKKKKKGMYGELDFSIMNVQNKNMSNVRHEKRKPATFFVGMAHLTACFVPQRLFD